MTICVQNIFKERFECRPASDARFIRTRLLLLGTRDQLLEAAMTSPYGVNQVLGSRAVNPKTKHLKDFTLHPTWIYLTT